MFNKLLRKKQKEDFQTTFISVTFLERKNILLHSLTVRVKGEHLSYIRDL